MLHVPILLALGLSCAVILPAAGVFLCGVILALQVILVIVRLAVARWDTSRTGPVTAGVDPIFSVHVATHNEPPAMLTNTLQALAAQTWPADRYEVIVIDNNTADPALWKPVENLCFRLGKRFTFLHRMGVRGAKAGALNIALAHTRPDTTHIVTVDADYRVEPQFLTHAADALRSTGADYVQFPQAYVGCDHAAAGVDAELEEYFRTNAQMADNCEAVLLTGTLCVVSKTALEAAGGWSGRTTTEDAEMGVRLCANGFSGRFIGQVVGRGYLPFSFSDLERQRHRWASGNLQTLITHAASILVGRNAMGWQRRGAIVSQLTAWLNLSLLPAVLLVVALLTGNGGTTLPIIAATCLLLGIADIVLRLTLRAKPDGTSAPVLLAAIVNRLALVPVSALATIEVLAGRQMHFVVTDKSGNRRHGAEVPWLSFVPFVAGGLVLAAAVAHGPIVTLGVIALMLPFPAALATAGTLRRYRTHLTSDRIGAPA